MTQTQPSVDEDFYIPEERKSETLNVEISEGNEDYEAKPIASSAVPETKSSKDGAIKKNKGDREDIPLKQLWAELVKDNGREKRSKSSKISQKDLKMKEKRIGTEPNEKTMEGRRSRKRARRPKSTNSNKPLD